MFPIATPALLVDLDRMHRNLDRAAGAARRQGLALRPHVKTHKSALVAAEQVRRGAVGLTCATPREAEVMAAVSDDLLVAYPPVDPFRALRLARLPASVRLMVGLDSTQAIDQMGRAARDAGRRVRVLVELDLGMRRVGVATAAEAVALARQVADHDALDYAGVMFYPGHIRGLPETQEEAIAALGQDLGLVLEALDQAGLPAGIVSGGSTPTLDQSRRIPGLTEIRPGTTVFNDRSTWAAGACAREDCALTVLATVVSTAVPGQAVVDAGTKALAREPRGMDQEGYGELLDRPQVTVRAMSEEHGILDLSHTDWRPAVGDQVRIIPNHVCVVVHLFDEAHGIRADVLETSWPIAARGR